MQGNKFNFCRIFAAAIDSTKKMDALAVIIYDLLTFHGTGLWFMVMVENPKSTYRANYSGVFFYLSEAHC